jgi:hypothetical protein
LLQLLLALRLRLAAACMQPLFGTCLTSHDMPVNGGRGARRAELHDALHMMRSCHYAASKSGSRAYGHAWVWILVGMPWLTAIRRVLAE